MANPNEPQSAVLVSRPQLTFALLLTLLVVPLAVVAQAAPSATFHVIHNFTGGKDGGTPYAGLIIDQSGNLYGTTFQGGRGVCGPQNIGCGTVFEMAPSASGWNFQPLYAFLGNNDGAGPYAQVAFGPDGSLYGTTNQGGNQSCLSGCGVVFRVKPPTKDCQSCAWTESVLHRFQGGSDGFYPLSNVTFDKAGNLYGTTEQSDAAGTVWELTHSHGVWTNTTIYDFYNQSGGGPYSGVVFDHGGNLYGTTELSNNFYGGVYQLRRSGSGWTEKSLYSFQGGKHGDGPTALILGKAGELIGATSSGGPKRGGTAFNLTYSKGNWSFDTLYAFSDQGVGGYGPWAQLTMDAAGNLYGTTWGESPGDLGTVFKLTHSSSGWKQTVLHRFTGGSDGAIPYSNIVFDNHGNLYGTASQGGAYNDGVVFEITP
ncbi:MAG TPA: choice-of-anchor tandem repeat GloVer-containing protein [Terriglobales bacterium]|jgi:uncharacterized repeat protein (TIGR03803 family)|nr:choice-of-anchor tandem repeat GloVer-containing protein [Terriglobales bacterium]